MAGEGEHNGALNALAACHQGGRKMEIAGPQPARAGLHFDGTGGAYFRIWIVNLLLTLLTLGLYSPWAKVRKARFFARHTVLLGDRFDFHGEPLRILLGRVLALLLLAAWTHAFQIHLWLGLAMLVLLCAAGPLLFASAQRFRYANTSWRGLRFGFKVPRGRVYALGLPLLLIWTSGSVAANWGVAAQWVAALGGLTALVLPWGHARLKQMQHAHARFGEQPFSFKPAVGAFYGLYLKALLFVIAGGFLGGIASAVIIRAISVTDRPVPSWQPTALGLLVGVLVWVVSWPFFAARLQQLVWSRTGWGEVQFSTTMRARRLWKLASVLSILTLLTLGLYWPFAAVALARYRIGSVQLEAAQGLPPMTAPAANPDARRAAGDAFADFAGLDLGW